jgi:phage shock protein PspC (stress-responsive transcriptional regulator)
MDELQSEPQTEPHDDTAAPEVTRLHRSTTRKVFGGVAGGIGERFDVDANIVRVVFVVLAFAYGLGAAIYLAMWVLIPRSSVEAADVAAEEELDPARVRWLRYALPLGVVVLVILIIAAFHGALGFGGLSVIWLLFLILIAIVALRAPARRLTFRRLLALCFLGFLSFLILLLGSFLIAVHVIGVPLKGGSGVKQWRPATIAEVQRTYHSAFGSSTIDLSSVKFAPGETVAFTATQGVGVLTVDVPTNVTLDLRTHVGIGKVQNGSFQLVGSATSGASKVTLDLNLQVGIGEIQINRPGAAFLIPIAPRTPNPPAPPSS